ncbi:polymeric immunoglobulin receptor-like [Stegastes partitus]|uniref:polymeric immunoglobulin receptor-like n=1 Tax=Stegastes partitus TaxID=144197 RepID=UPI000496DEB7|nr:PREDICTED: polymeric immunoglobulin receptor-like [Stegastes partitus]
MKTLKVIIKQHENLWNQRCNRPGNSSESVELEFEVEDKKCPKTRLQNTYRGIETTITCDHSGNKQKPKFFCKDKDYICEDFLSNNSSLISDGRFSITDTESGFGVSISNVSPQDAGVYWCGVQSRDEKHIQTVLLTKIQLEVKRISFSTRSPTIGTNFTYWCGYKRADCDINCTKFICKGEDPYRCERLASTTEPDLNERFSMTDDTTEKNITITVREVTANDTGTYWCGAESRDQQHNQQFFHKLSINVGES